MESQNLANLNPKHLCLLSACFLSFFVGLKRNQKENGLLKQDTPIWQIHGLGTPFMVVETLNRSPTIPTNSKQVLDDHVCTHGSQPGQCPHRPTKARAQSAGLIQPHHNYTLSTPLGVTTRTWLGQGLKPHCPLIPSTGYVVTTQPTDRRTNQTNQNQSKQNKTNQTKQPTNQATNPANTTLPYLPTTHASRPLKSKTEMTTHHHSRACLGRYLKDFSCGKSKRRLAVEDLFVVQAQHQRDALLERHLPLAFFGNF